MTPLQSLLYARSQWQYQPDFAAYSPDPAKVATLAVAGPVLRICGYPERWSPRRRRSASR
jgi:hypothetical protein